MTYRGMDPETPLIVMQLPMLRAIDRRTGKLLWETNVGFDEVNSSAPGRFVPTKFGLFVLAGPHLWCIDMATGKRTGGVELPFTPQTVLFDGKTFFLTAVQQTIAVTLEGKILWRMRPEEVGFISRGKLVCRDADGKQLWETENPAGSLAAGLMVGDLVSQPDDHGVDT